MPSHPSARDPTHDTSLLDTLLRYIIPINRGPAQRTQTAGKESELEQAIREERRGQKRRDHAGRDDDSRSDGKTLDPLKKITDSIDDILDRQNEALKRHETASKVSYHAEKEAPKKDYTLTIDYTADHDKEELSIRFESIDDSYTLPGQDTPGKPLTFNFSRKREQGEKLGYSVQLRYKLGHGKEMLDMEYSADDSYLADHIRNKNDTSNNVQLKNLNIFPETIMGGVLGFTYLGENFMGRREDLQGSMARMVDIHESIHTHDEYETRVLTDWIMAGSEVPKYTPLHFAMPKDKYVK